jgi:hypothetical protein
MLYVIDLQKLKTLNRRMRRAVEILNSYFPLLMHILYDNDFKYGHVAKF